MSLLKVFNDSIFFGGKRVTSSQLIGTNITQIRTATKRVSGSKTNKNDSAGRRLGPKAYEGHFVKPGQIIMRQRGTKIHPGENVDIGKDHTIYAVEPGFVRFYYDPFHPLRKYVGVALKKDLTLPTPHFSPRVRRFGFEEILNVEEAEIEENHMSRKEYLQQPELQKIKQSKEEIYQSMFSKFRSSLTEGFNVSLKEDDLNLITSRLVNIWQFINLGQSIEESRIQASYNILHDLKLQRKRGEILESQWSELDSHYRKIFQSFDEEISVDVSGEVIKYELPEVRQARRNEIFETLDSRYYLKLLSVEDRKSISSLILSPGIFTKKEQIQLEKKYLPEVLPLTIPESIVEDIDPNSPPKDVTLTRVFDDKSRKIKIVGRRNDATV